MKITTFLDNLYHYDNENNNLCQFGKYSYSQLFTLTNAIINKLEATVKHGDKVVLIADHNELAICTIIAASALGLTVVLPYNLSDAAIAEWSAIIKQSAPKAVIFIKSNPYVFEELTQKYINPDKCIEISLDNLKLVNNNAQIFCRADKEINNFLILFTSGTSNEPKAVSISENLICRQTISVSSKLGFSKDSIVFLSGLINNTTGIIFSLGSLYHCSKLVIPESMNVATWPSIVEKYYITHIMLRPMAMETFIDTALKEKTSLKSLECVAHGAAMLPKNTLRIGRDILKCRWVQGYGLSESFGPFCWIDENDYMSQMNEKYPYCIGKPSSDIKMSFIDDNMHFSNKSGEIVIKGQLLMNGYYDFESNKVTLPTIYDGWFRTGDYGYCSSDGTFSITGRKSNLILTRNGHQVCPEEIEQSILSIKEINNAVLLKIDFPGDSKIFMIISSLNYDYAKVEARIREHFFLCISKEKWPDYLFITNNNLPQNSNGKTSRKECYKLINHEKVIKL